MVAKATRPAASSRIRRIGRKLVLQALGGAAGVLQTFTEPSPVRRMPLLRDPVLQPAPPDP